MPLYSQPLISTVVSKCIYGDGVLHHLPFNLTHCTVIIINAVVLLVICIFWYQSYANAIFLVCYYVSGLAHILSHQVSKIGRYAERGTRNGSRGAKRRAKDLAVEAEYLNHGMAMTRMGNLDFNLHINCVVATPHTLKMLSPQGTCLGTSGH